MKTKKDYTEGGLCSLIRFISNDLGREKRCEPLETSEPFDIKLIVIITFECMDCKYRSFLHNKLQRRDGVKEYILRYYEGNDIWLERLVRIPEEALTAFTVGDSEFLLCYNEGKMLFVNKDLIYTIEEVK